MLKNALSHPSHELRAICSPSIEHTINFSLSQPGRLPRALGCQKSKEIKCASPVSSLEGAPASPKGGQRRDGNDVINACLRGRSIQGASLSPHTQLVCMRSSLVGFKHNFTGIQTSICHEATQIQWYNSLSG